MSNTVIGVFDNFAQAQSALKQLLSSGFSSTDVRLRPAEDTQQARTAALKAAGASDSGSSMSAGTDTADTTETHGFGTLRNFFHDLFSGSDSTETDMTQTHADRYAEAVRRGSFVLTAEASSEQQADAAAATMQRFDPVDVDERASQWQAAGWSAHDENAAPLTDAEVAQDRSAYMTSLAGSAGMSANQSMPSTAAMPATPAAPTMATAATQSPDSQQQAIPIVEEELKVGKRAVQRGGIRVVQRVVETPVQETLNLRQEHVVVERHAVDQPATAAELASMKEGTIELREMGEEAVVSKTARVVEEVIIGKEISEKETVISDTVRRTDVSVEQLGAGSGSTGTSTGMNAGMSADAMGGISGAQAGDDDFRNHWQSAYGTGSQRYEEYAPAYQYGSSMGSDQRYQGKDWATSEPAIRQQWESANPQNAWEKVKDAVQYGWNKVAH